MAIQRSGQFDPLHRLQPIFNDPDDGQHKNNQKPKKVLYQGRSWTEKEEEQLSIVPSAPKKASLRAAEKAPLYADLELYKKAKKYFDSLTTLEEKIAQLCFYQTEASYDPLIMNEVKELIQKGQVGGILFTSGEYKRQLFLIEYYQSLAKTPLLLGNDFCHGLHFLFEGSQFTKESSEQRYYDLGKVVMNQNRHMKVHFQCDKSYDESEEKWQLLSEMERKAFRKGIRAANGIVGKFQTERKSKTKKWIPQFSLNASGMHAEFSLSIEEGIREIIGLKTIEFFNLSSENLATQDLLSYFQKSREFLLCSKNISGIIQSLVELVQAGAIKEEDIDKRVFKALLIKAIFWK